MSKRVADVLVETLQAAGVKNCYGIVGDTLNRIAHAIERSEIDWVHMRQVICLAGDGGLTMLLGDLLTAVQEDLPIKIVVYDNGKLGFVDIEQKAAGLMPVYTDLKNPNFGEVAKTMGLWGLGVSKAGDLEESVRTFLAQPGPALLHAKVKPTQLVIPPSPFVSPEAVVGMAVYTAKAMLHGKGHDVWEMVVENIP